MLYRIPVLTQELERGNESILLAAPHASARGALRLTLVFALPA